MANKYGINAYEILKIRFSSNTGKVTASRAGKVLLKQSISYNEDRDVQAYKIAEMLLPDNAMIALGCDQNSYYATPFYGETIVSPNQPNISDLLKVDANNG